MRCGWAIIGIFNDGCGCDACSEYAARELERSRRLDKVRPAKDTKREVAKLLRERI